MDILTALNMLHANMDKLTVTGIESANRLSVCGDLLNGLISAVESARSEQEERAKEEENGR